MQTLPVLLNLQVASYNLANKNVLLVDITARYFFDIGKVDHKVLQVLLRLGLSWIWPEQSRTEAAW